MNKRMIAGAMAVLCAAALLSGCNPSKPGPTSPSGTAAPSAPTASPTGTPTTPPTAPPPTSAPTVPPTTAPAGSDGEMIGKLYTRGELMAMENEKKSYGPGTTKDGIRPGGAVALQEQYGNLDANFIGPDNNCIYLTFDCGYEYTYKDSNGKDVRVTEQILDVLKQKNVKAVFFVTMYYCKQSPDLVQRMVNEGHAVGNHSNNHPVMPTLSIDDMVYEVMSLHDYVQENFGYTMHLFRPPEGAYSTRSLAVLQSLGYKTVDWSFAHADWDPANQPSVADGMKTALGRVHSGAIYLLHAVSRTNADMLSDLIDKFGELGYEVALFT